MFNSFKHFRDLYLSLFFVIGLIVVGTIGFILIDDYPVVDAFYMTIITMSTVGFGEIHPLSQAGRIFASFLIIVSFSTFAFTVSSITKYLMSGEYKTFFRDLKVNKEISNLENHVIVCGYGRTGAQAVKTLLSHHQPFVIIDTNTELIEKIRVEKNFFYVEGNAIEEDILIKAGIRKAKALMTTLPDDADNLYLVLSARELNPKINIISRASHDGAERKLRMAGASNVIMPDRVGGTQMASLVMIPDLVEFLDCITIQGKSDVNLEEIKFENIPDGLQYKTLRELSEKHKTGCQIIGYKTPENKYIVNPSPDLELIPGSKLFVLGAPDQIKQLNDIFGVKSPVT